MDDGQEKEERGTRIQSEKADGSLRVAPMGIVKF